MPRSVFLSLADLLLLAITRDALDRVRVAGIIKGFFFCRARKEKNKIDPLAPFFYIEWAVLDLRSNSKKKRYCHR